MAYKEFQVDGIGKVKIYKRKSNRSLRLSVAADGDVRVTMPLWAPYKAGVAFTFSKRAWILSQSIRNTDILYNGMPVGKSHHLVFKQNIYADDIKSSIRQTEITVLHPAELSTSSEQAQTIARAACLRALRIQAKSLLSQRLQQLAAAHGLSYKSLAIKRMKSRWGSCDQQNNIVLNLYLVQLPWELIDYVILHELAHTQVMHHGADFWSLLESLKPDAKQFRKSIKLYAPTLLVP